MSQGLEYAPAEEQSYDYESAPCSAVFYIGEGQWATPRPKKSKRPKIVRGLHQKPVPLLPNGLVNFDGMSTYLHPNPNGVPLYKTRGWKYHHALFSWCSFERPGYDDENRNAQLRRLHRSSWQQLHMRVSSEAVFHLAHEMNVPHPPIETTEAALDELERLDMIGAATIFLCLSRGSSQYKIDQEALSPDWMNDIDEMEKLGFITEVREDMTRSLVRTEVIPQRLVTSALARLSLHTNRDPYITKLTERRLGLDPIFYPVRVPSHKVLLDKAKKMIALEFIHGQSVTTKSMQIEDGALYQARERAA